MTQRKKKIKHNETSLNIYEKGTLKIIYIFNTLMLNI